MGIVLIFRQILITHFSLLNYIKRAITLKKIILLVGFIFHFACYAEPVNIQFASLNSSSQVEGLFFFKPNEIIHNKNIQQKNSREINQEALILKAKQYLVKNQQVFGIESFDNLFFKKITSDRLGRKHLRFARTYQGIKVENIEIIVHFNQNNQVASVNGYLQDLPVNVRTSIERALKNGTTVSNSQAILNKVAQNLKTSVSQLKVLSNQPIIVLSRPYLIWKVDVVARSIRYSFKLTDEIEANILDKTVNVQHYHKTR